MEKCPESTDIMASCFLFLSCRLSVAVAFELIKCRSLSVKVGLCLPISETIFAPCYCAILAKNTHISIYWRQSAHISLQFSFLFGNERCKLLVTAYIPARACIEQRSKINKPQCDRRHQGRTRHFEKARPNGILGVASQMTIRENAELLTSEGQS